MHPPSTANAPRAPLLVAAVLLLSLLLQLGGCASVTNPVTGRSELTVMDEASEIAEGKKGHQQVLAEYGLYRDEKLQAYVNGVGQRLAQQSHRANLQWTFTVLDSPEINAFALPGGYVYITRGIMAYLDSEADLAGVLGHEIGHVTARHGAQQATRQQVAGLGVLAATVLGAVVEGVTGVSGATNIAGQAAQGAAAGLIASYSRDQELQADKLGAEYLARNHYDPKNMVDVIELLKNQERFAEDSAKAEGRSAPPRNDWLSSHPSNDQRLQEIRRIAAGYTSARPADYADDGHARYLQAIDGMTFGESREQGVTRGRNFYHEPLGIALTAPVGWSIRNGAEAIVLLSGERDAALLLRLVPPKAGATHDEIIRNVIKPDSGKVERVTTAGGLAATRFDGTRRNAQGQSQPVAFTLVSGPGERNYLLLQAARDRNAMQRSQAALREAEGSLRALTAADRAAAKPWTIRSVDYRGGGLQALARQSPLPTYAEQQLKLLNGFYAEGEPKPGQRLKIVEAR